MLRSYLQAEPVPIDQAAGSIPDRIDHNLPLHDAPTESRLRWLRAGYRDHVPVPVSVVASGPKVIRLAAALGDRVVLAVGADPVRVKWGIDLARSANPGARIGMYVNVVVDDDIERGVALAVGGITSFARFSVMHGRVNGPVSETDRASLEGLSSGYQMSRHFSSANQATQQGQALAKNFAIIGPARYCIERLIELGDLGVDRFYVVGPTRDADRDAAVAAGRRFALSVLPHLSASS
jgi:5,10-methylenetetrahydromethanopterin reductase